MPSPAVELPDGSFLIICLAQTGASDEQVLGRTEGTLDAGTVAADVAVYVGDAIGAGVTFEVLKKAAVDLYERVRGQQKHAPASPSDIRDEITSFLVESGYSDVRVTELRHILGEGWAVTGAADGTRFRALADESGTLLHIRVR